MVNLNDKTLYTVRLDIINPTNLVLPIATLVRITAQYAVQSEHKRFPKIHFFMMFWTDKNISADARFIYFRWFFFGN